MSRFSDIRRGAQLNQALTNYLDYLTQPRDPQIGSRGPRPPQKVAYVVPFGFDLGGPDEVIQVTNSVRGYAALAGNVNSAAGAEVADALGAKEIFPINGFSPARVVWNRAANKTLVAKRSKFTNQQYGAYENVDRDSCAFGRQAADDDMHDAFQEVKAAIIAANAGLEINRVTLTRERRKYR